MGESRFTLSLTVNSLHRRLGCELYLRGPSAKQSFKRIKEVQKGIEDILGILARAPRRPRQRDCGLPQRLRPKTQGRLGMGVPLAQRAS